MNRKDNSPADSLQWGLLQINLLPWRVQRRIKQRKYFVGILLACCTMALGAILLIYFLINIRIEQQQKQNNLFSQQLMKLTMQAQQLTELQRQQQQYSTQLAALQKIDSARWRGVQLVNDLARLIPEGVFLSKVVQQENGVTITGTAQSTAQIALLMHNIEKIKGSLLKVSVETNAHINRLAYIQDFNIQMIPKAAHA